MYRCHKCNSRMVKVELIDIRGQTYTAIVCTHCGRLHSRDKAFKENIRLI